MAFIKLAEGAAAATPATGTVVAYAKTDGYLYSKDDAGTETQLGGAVVTNTEQSLTNYYLPSLGSAFQDKYRSGELPYCFNQQWGGAQMLAPSGSGNSCATLQIQRDTATGSGVGSGAGSYYVDQPFKVSETATFDSAELRLSKTGNPAGTLTVRIWSDSAGSPNAAIGSAATLAPKVLTSKSDGEWYTVTGLACALTAGTQYHLVATIAGTDGSNYVNWHSTSASKYPYGAATLGTSVPAWTPVAGYAQCFAIINPAANSIIQSGGMFDYKLAFNPGTPWNQSRMTGSVLANYWDGKTCTYLHRGTYAVSTNVVDYTYGVDHDRFTLTINGSGYPVLTVYRSDRTAYTVTGTGSVTSSNHDVGFRLRTAGDGADYATLYVDGVSVGTPLTAQTFTMDANFNLLGTRITGGGFGLAPTWTQDMQMTSLPSAQGWTKSGTGTEANCFSIQNNKLYQNATGFASTDTCFYQKTVSFVNATGWAVTWKSRSVSSTNLSTNASIALQIGDGTKILSLGVSDYFIQIASATGLGTPDFTVQGDFKSQEHVFAVQGKGSDYYLFIDGKLVIDGTGKFVTANGTNSISFGDYDGSPGWNADAIWSYVKYYQGGMILPVANTGTCSEFAHWSGDKSALFPSLYNSGTPVSVKQLCGVPRNYQYEAVVQREVRIGVTTPVTTTSATAVLSTDMEQYVIGSNLTITAKNSIGIAAIGQDARPSTYVDGVAARISIVDPAVNTYFIQGDSDTVSQSALGLHKVEQRWQTTGSTLTSNLSSRLLVTEARS